jgi:septation ring formation regulator EzrA
MATTPRKTRKTARKAPTARDEYKAALADLNRYSENNETGEAVDARKRLDKAERKRSRWGFR